MFIFDLSNQKIVSISIFKFKIFKFKLLNEGSIFQLIMLNISVYTYRIKLIILLPRHQ